MARPNVIVTHPESKDQMKSPGKQAPVSQPSKAASGPHVKRDTRTGMFVLPPGPPNTIVRTPYPIAPKDGDPSD